MGAGKTISRLGEIAAVASTATAIAELIENKTASIQSNMDFDDDDHIKEMLEYLDGMVADIKQIHKRQDEYNETLKRLETRINNVNIRVDNLAGGK